MERIGAVAALLLMASLLGLLGYWQFLEQLSPPIVVKAGSSHLDKRAYFAGDKMRVSREVCWTTLRPYQTHRAFVDGLFYALTDFQSAQPFLGCRSSSLVVEIPEALPPGDYFYRVWLDFDINPIKTVRVFLPDVPLTVMAKE